MLVANICYHSKKQYSGTFSSLYLTVKSSAIGLLLSAIGIAEQNSLPQISVAYGSKAKQLLLLPTAT